MHNQPIMGDVTATISIPTRNYPSPESSIKMVLHDRDGNTYEIEVTFTSSKFFTMLGRIEKIEVSGPIQGFKATNDVRDIPVMDQDGRW